MIEYKMEVMIKRELSIYDSGTTKVSFYLYMMI